MADTKGKMTIERLKQYKKMKKYVETADDGIENLSLFSDEAYTGDSVVGSSSSFPYTKHTIILTGFGADRKKMRHIRNTKAEYLREIAEIDKFIDSLTDVQLRQIMHYKYRDREEKTWRTIAIAICCTTCDKTPLMMVKRYLEKL